MKLINLFVIVILTTETYANQLPASCNKNETLLNNTLTEERKQNKNNCDCGIANRRRRIVGGKETPVNKYPWVVAFFLVVNDNLFQFCGGTLIGHWYILSAAHCFHRSLVKKYEIWASLGDHDLSSTRETPNIVRSISKVIVHEYFDDTTHVNDVSLAKVSKRVTFSEHVRPICMPPRYFTTIGKKGIVTGWGLTRENGVASTKLREVVVPILPNSQCAAAYRRARVYIASCMLCAGYARGGYDACQGDSGGSMVYQCEDNYFQIGIVSFGLGCGRPGYPGVYTRLSGQIWEWVVDNAVGEVLCGRTCYYI